MRKDTLTGREALVLGILCGICVVTFCLAVYGASVLLWGCR